MILLICVHLRLARENTKALLQDLILLPVKKKFLPFAIAGIFLKVENEKLIDRDVFYGIIKCKSVKMVC